MSSISDSACRYFGEAIGVRAGARPAAPAIVSDAGTVDFATFDRAVRAQADAFARAGIGRGARVALAMRDDPPHIAALFALQRLAAVPFIIGAGDPPGIRDALAAAAGATVAVGTPDDDAGWPVPFVAIGAGGDPAAALPPPPGPDDLCGFRRSSGTTAGVPRLTPVTHRYELAQLEFLQSTILWATGDRYLSIVSMAFELGRVSVQHALLCGSAVVLPPPLAGVDDLVAFVRRTGATWTSITPTHLRHLLDRAGPQPILPGLALLTTSAMLTQAERVRVMAGVSPALYVLYATNEVGLIAVAGPDDLRRVPGTVGRPVAAIRVEVVDAAGQPVPTGAVGEVRASHPAYPSAYAAGEPGASSRFAGGWFYTGDLGCFDADGHLFLRGRTDDVINVGGRKVYPTEIVECLAAHAAVAEAAVVGIRERRSGAVPVAAVVLRAPASEEELLRHCRTALRRGHSPARIIALDALPKTAGAKVDRVALRRLLFARVAG
ncbi:class I adenylate-forming enzyme family protein [Stella sp.]|uniref:class I adenylate-forming enzyme family protein n=1 Tax=Stella sp. TaxID=2912054 RepID=UPI0035B3F4D7